MARGAIAEPPGPPIVRTYTVGDNRIRLESEQLEALVPWLDGKSVTRTAVPGPRGGVIVLPPETVGDAVDRLEPGSLTAGAAATRRADHARFLGMRWPVTFSFEQKARRYTVGLPEGARQLGLLPSEDDQLVVLFISGDIFEIWDRDDWLEHVRSLALTVAAVTEELG